MYLNNIHSTNENAQVSGLTHWMKYDISCYLSSAKPDETQFIKRFNREGLAQEDFVSGRACTWFMDPEVLEKWSFIPTQSTFKIWTQLLRSDSFSVFRIHDNRAEYLVFSPFRIPAKPPYLHTNIEYENPWVKEWNPSIYKAARTYPRLWNAISPITSYAGFWWVVILLLTLKNSSYFPIFAISTVLNVSIFVVAIIPDARFVAFTLISGIALITSEFLKLLSKGRDFLRLNQRV
jgi:hypothetical protein